MRASIDGWRILGLLLVPTMLYSALMTLICPELLPRTRQLMAGTLWIDVIGGIVLLAAGAWHWRRNRPALGVLGVAASWQTIMWLELAGRLISPGIAFAASAVAAATVLYLTIWTQPKVAPTLKHE